MNERMQLALIVGCGFVIGLEAPTAARLVFEGWTGPYAAPASIAQLEPDPRAPVAQTDVLADAPEDLVAHAQAALPED